MRLMAVAFVLEHWRFFLGFLVFGVTAGFALHMIRRASATRAAKEEAARGQVLDAEMAKIRADLEHRSPPS